MITNILKKNAKGWVATIKDYRLVFRPVDGMWREISNNLPEYSGVCLADYLQQVNVAVPDGCTFCRVIRGGFHFEYRDFSAYVRIDVDII